MSKVFRIKDENGAPVYRAFKHEAVRVARRASVKTDRVIEIERIELAEMPKLQLVEALLNDHAWSEGEPVVVARFRDGDEIAGSLEEDVPLTDEENEA
ncbi:hypothetical protein ABID82_005060 [Methylobacterium sp. PvP062]|uniref:Uncharacterized protein n=1 Tax=Methylobacterium radiotolerans TaxID=31998 RepID=A0ABV2NUB6_9HYPH|nr:MULTISPECIES: hypothetical protein [unclassified Methylobacterium]MBP2498374.1 hypothetical protein [Methylobacterium sp. PvP105]MBP2505758.1 hypothetical protein [Methylobacterium sp. PvP109]